jgi:ABC-type antimicrobial peptide transport system permease subunit
VTRTFEGVFFEVRPTDLWVYALVGCGLLALGLAAAFGPARRASRVDPLISLRSE